MRILIDGHNLIGQLPDIQLQDPDDEQQLLARLQPYVTRTGHQLTVIFDGGPAGDSRSKLGGGRLLAIFAPPGRTADALIIQRIWKLRDRTGWLVVSSDRRILDAAGQRGIRTQTAAAFAAELERMVSDSASDPRHQPPSPDEVEAWLAEFSHRKRPKS